MLDVDEIYDCMIENSPWYVRWRKPQSIRFQFQEDRTYMVFIWYCRRQTVVTRFLLPYRYPLHVLSAILWEASTNDAISLSLDEATNTEATHHGV